MAFILEQSRAEVLITADQFGHLDYLANLDGFRGRLDALREVFVVGDRVPAGTRPFKTLASAEPIDGPVATDPSAPALIAYTSGTTADPKGVVHSHRTIGFEVKQLGAIQSMRGLSALTGLNGLHGLVTLALSTLTGLATLAALTALSTLSALRIGHFDPFVRVTVPAPPTVAPNAVPRA